MLSFLVLPVPAPDRQCSSKQQEPLWLTLIISEAEAAVSLKTSPALPDPTPPPSSQTLIVTADAGMLVVRANWTFLVRRGSLGDRDRVDSLSVDSTANWTCLRPAAVNPSAELFGLMSVVPKSVSRARAIIFSFHWLINANSLYNVNHTRNIVRKNPFLRVGTIALVSYTNIFL